MEVKLVNISLSYILNRGSILILLNLVSLVLQSFGERSRALVVFLLAGIKRGAFHIVSVIDLLLMTGSGDIFSL